MEKRKKAIGAVGEWEYWRNVIHVLCKTYNWTRDYVLSLCENEIYQHLFEIKLENIHNAMVEYLVKGNIRGLMQLDDNDAVKILYIKHRDEAKKEELERDKIMITSELKELQDMGVKIPKDFTVN